MTEQRKSIPWCWWTIAALMLLVTYSLSIGPANYFWHRGYIPEALKGPVLVIYAPLRWLIENGPQSVKGISMPYLVWWTQ